MAGNAKDTLKGNGDALAALMANVARTVARAGTFLKCIVILGSAVVAVAQFAAPPWPMFIPVAAAVAIALSAVVLLFFERNSAQELNAAYAATERAREETEHAVKASEENERMRRELDDLFEELEQVGEDDERVERALSLYQATLYMNQAIEGSVVSRVADEAKVIDLLFTVAGRQLVIAADFAQSDEYTLCVYRAEKTESGNVELVLVQHRRAIPCDLAAARRWPAGVGVAGIAYSSKREIVVPDLQGDDSGTAFRLPDQLSRPTDQSRYRSIIAVPIQPAGDSEPWGIAVGTNDTPYHFSLDAAEDAPPTLAVRTLAELVETTVVACRTVAHISSEAPASA